MISMTGKLLIFDKPDVCSRVFPKDCKITFADKIPVTLNFSNKPEDVLGSGSVVRTSDGLSCDIRLHDYIEDELYIGGYYNKISRHVENGVTVITAANLCGISIIPEHQSADRELKIYLKEDKKHD